MKKNLNIAVIGSGFMGKAHSFKWLNVDKFYDLEYKPVLKTLVSRNPEGAAEFAEKWGWEKVVPDWREAVDDPEIDVIDISTPTFTHHDIAIAAAKAGKHIYCEKPCSIGAQQAKEMAEAADAAGVVHYLNHNYRRVPAIAYAKQLIEEGRLGTIYHYRGAYLQDWIMDPSFPKTWHFYKEQAGGGPLYDLMSHAVDTARFLIGELKAVSAIQKTFIKERPLPGQNSGVFNAGKVEDGVKSPVEVDDASFMIAEFENGALGSFDTSRFGAGRKNFNTFEIYGSRGALCFDFERMNELQYLNLDDPADEQGFRTLQVTNATHPYAGAWWAPGHGIGYENTMVNAAADFVLAIQKGTQITPNLNDGVKIMRVLDAIELSDSEKRRVEIAEVGV